MNLKLPFRKQHRGPEYVEYQFQRWNGRGPLVTVIAVQLLALIAMIAYIDTLPASPPEAPLSMGSEPQVTPH